MRAEMPPAHYLAATPAPLAPEGLCWSATERVLCNSQLPALADSHADALGQCNADKAAVRAWGDERMGRTN